MTTIIGIDPGLTGAVAAIIPQPDGVVLVQLFDTPTLTVKNGKGKRHEYALAQMRFILQVIQGPKVAAIESVHAMPGQGVRSMFSMGYGCGAWEGILAALQIPYTKIIPQRWKKALMDGMGKEKSASIVVAARLFPEVASQLTRRKDDGRADALLIAEYHRRTMNL